MPRRHTLPPQQIRLKTEKLSTPVISPLKNILTDNNERKCDNGTLGKEMDSSKYLHKKFKKVATLEEATPVAVCGGEATNSPPDAGSMAASPCGRYVCPYCAMPCAKPSVLQKHIRAHTNERPYPCRPCGFAFKTKSNLYKHCRSRAHTLKMDVTDCCSNPSSGEEEDSESCGSPNADSDRPSKNKIYKPKFHTLQGQEDSNLPPTAQVIADRINRLMCDVNDPSMVEPAYIARLASSPNKEECPEAASPFPSRLALALLRPPPTTALSDSSQPLNLSQKEMRLQGDPTHTIDCSLMQDIFLKARCGLNGYKEDASGTGVECPDCKQIVDKLDIHLRVSCLAQSQTTVRADSDVVVMARVTERSSSTGGSGNDLPSSGRISDISRTSDDPVILRRSLDSAQGIERAPDGPSLLGRSLDMPPGLVVGVSRMDVTPALKSPSTPPVTSRSMDDPPLLGRTALVEPLEKRRKLSPKSHSNVSPPDLIPMVDSAAHHKSVRLFGGQVKILDGPGGEARTLRIESGHESPPPTSETVEPKDRKVLTISKTRLHSVGLTVIQSDSNENRKCNESLTEKIVVPILANIQRPNPTFDSLSTITAYNPLTLPPRISEPLIVQPLTIVHGGKAIPHVPGMPGPNSLLDPSLVRNPAQSPSATSINKSEPSSQSQHSVNRSQEEKQTSLGPVTVESESQQELSKSAEVSSEKKFVRPTWLPLKAGTYIAKKPPSTLGLGPPPVALVSPETPRPRKSYGQLYLNGHAYTYLGLKCSSKMFFCTLNKPQPIYVPLTPEHASLSMYSNWKVVSESALSPLGLSATCVMSSYDSRNQTPGFSQAGSPKYQVMHSSYSSSPGSTSPSQTASLSGKETELSAEDVKRLKICNGGYESTEDYVYIRGRGRGRYVCEECGVRCCKPSMLKKHIRTTHSDLRPYSCKYCSFSFKTKGNLTKHMKSKTHFKQCLDLDVNPVPMSVDSSNIDKESLAKQNALFKELGGDLEVSSEETEDEDEEENLSESEDEERGKMEREAAASLLSLSEVAQQSALKDYANLGLLSASVRPLTYPYSLSQESKAKSVSDSEESQIEPLELTSSSKQILPTSADVISPIDLSNKTFTDVNAVSSLETETRLLLSPSILSSVNRVGVATSPAVSMLASPLSTSSIISDEGCALMTAYLKEKAARDTQIKQQQYKHNSSLTLRLSQTEDRTPVILESPTIVTSSTSASPLMTDSRNVDSRTLDYRIDRRNIDCRIVDSGSVDSISTSNVRVNESNRSLELRISDTSAPVEAIQEGDSRPVAENLTGEIIVTENSSNDRVSSDSERPFSISTSESNETAVTLDSSVSDTEAMEVVEFSDSREKRSDEIVTMVSHPSNLSIKETSSTVTNIVNHSAKESALGILALTSSQAAAKQPSSILPPQSKLKAEFLPPSSGPNYINVLEEGKSVCGICQKVFNKPSQLRLHVNIHYFERPFRCDSCGVSFRTKGHLQKHQRSISHLNKVNMNSTFGTATMSNPRPFKCTDCKIAFRIHGHLAKHLRSKMHIMRLECLGKLPFGMYAELERSGLNIHDIDTTDCHNSLESLQLLAQKLHEKDPTKLGQWAAPIDGADRQAGDIAGSAGETSSDEEDSGSLQVQTLAASQSCSR